MKKRICLRNVWWMAALLICLASGNGFAQRHSSGILIGGGPGAINTRYERPLSQDKVGTTHPEFFNYNLFLGYRCQLNQNHLFFWNMDALLGMQSAKDGELVAVDDEGYLTVGELPRNLKYYIALSPSFNIRAYRGLYAGVGIEPTLYFHQSRAKGGDFHLPANIRLGYDFGPVSLEGTVGIDLLRHSEKDLLKSNRTQTFSLSLYIPLWRK